jgi:hypothetical protein
MKSKFLQALALQLVVVLICMGVRQPATACPFCSAVSQTFAEEMGSMDLIVFAELTEPVKAEEDENGDIPKSKFLVKKVLKGDAWIKAEETIEVHFFGTPKKGKTYLLMATDPPEVMWGSPLRIAERAQEYLLTVMTLPEEAERLKFFMDYLEDEDEMLARDAYDEFARTPYEGVIAVKDAMNRKQLLDWIKDPDVPTTRRRLYFTMLGVCGTEADAIAMEKLMRSENKEDRAGLNAMVASYLSLKGATGMPVIEELFLANPDAEYADIYAAIMAIRFHGNEGNVIDKKDLLPGLRGVLERDEMADLVIPDLARWEDWTVVDRLGKLFKNAKKESNWVRVPVINYLRACPLPAAETMIAELKKIDSDAVERANTFFPYTQFEGEKRGGTAGEESPEAAAGASAAPKRIEDMTPKEREEVYGISRHRDRTNDTRPRSVTRKPIRRAKNMWFYVVPIAVAMGIVCNSLLGKRSQVDVSESENS